MTPAPTLKTYLFPLQEMVFFPTTTIPLNIFEPRYIQMINDSMATEDPITMVMADIEINETIHQVRYPLKSSEIVAGCGHPSLLKRRDDDTMMILLKGYKKIRLGRVLQTLPYIVCEYTEVHEDNSMSEPSRFIFNRIEKTLLAWIQTNISGTAEKASLQAKLDKPNAVIEWFSLFLISDSLIRQTILETDDLNLRIQLISRLVFHQMGFAGNTPSASEFEN
ncbi:MAG: LON peptidase substrate-binding domain-containing protein [Bdellovibrionales bacterium]|nr:LON peptidase substrate-binding domain-containing protein [Bdellovibrionales bacterium]